MDEPAAELVARLGGRFVLRGEYRGGEGRTLRVAPADGGPELVLKVLPPGIEPAEASLLLSLQHPAIPAVREVGRLPDGRAFVLREHVDGDALRALPAEPTTLARTLQQLLEVLAYVHLRGVVHLDLKPGNLVVDAAGTLHLLDFGLGTRTGGAARGGTPFFAAPELLLGLVPDARADLFAVGAMAAHAAWPPHAVSLAAFVARFPAVGFFDAAGFGEHDLPAPLGAFVARCVAREPGRRFADAQAALEFLAGGSGRPSAALLVPDPVATFARELGAVAAAGGDVVLRGAQPEERRALALHLAATRTDVARVTEARDEVRVHRTGGSERVLELPPLDAPRLLPHLQQAFGLDGDAAAAAARWLAPAAAARAGGAATVLLDLVHAGEIVPAGSRWSWPAARAGRLRVPAAGQHPLCAAAAVTREDVHAAAASGQRERAIALWQRAAAARADAEPELRRALAEGLLDGGEPARALPFCGGDAALRAQALFDTGQVDAAQRALDAAPAAAAPARQRRLRARIAIARGEPRRAVEVLARAPATVHDRITLAAALAQTGDVETAAAQLRDCVARTAADGTFAAASARTELGHVLRQRGELAAARAQFEAASDVLFRLGHVRHAATAQLNLGVIAKDLGEHARAVEHLREARTLFREVGDAGQTAAATASLGIAALARGDAAAARPWLETGAAERLRLGNVAAGVLAQAMLARAHAELGELERAREVAERIGAPTNDRVRAELARVHELLQRPAPSPATDLDDVPPPPAGPSRELFRTLLAVNRQLAQETDVDKAMRRLLDAAVTLSGGRLGYLLVQRDDGMRREFASGDGGQAGQAFSRSLANRAIQLQRTLTGGDALADRDLHDAPSIRNLEVRSAVCAPFRSAGGTAGAIYVEHPGRAGAFVDADKEALEMLADQAAIAVDRMLREQALASELAATSRELAVVKRAARRGAVTLLGDSAPMRELRAAIDRLAPLDLPVLVLGETGTGKELVARALHERSHRHKGPFVAENCSALPAELMERELFGHVKGAFTGADADRPGLLELASGGTLFLDEIGDMPAALQAKLLRALQERTIRRIGAAASLALDLRLVAATHRDVRAMVQRGEFREDLFFRVAAVELRVPPLRERDGDVLLLAEAFLQRHADTHGRRLRLSPAVEAALAAYPWPGNVRELEHVIARAALLTDGERIHDAQLPRAPVALPAGDAAVPAPPPIVTLKEAERRAIVAALQACGGDKAQTARTLGISRSALYQKLERHGLGS